MSEIVWTLSPQSALAHQFGSLRMLFKRGSRGWRRHIRRMKREVAA